MAEEGDEDTDIRYQQADSFTSARKLGCEDGAAQLQIEPDDGTAAHVRCVYHINPISLDRLNTSRTGIVGVDQLPRFDRAWFEKIAANGVPVIPHEVEVVACRTESWHPSVIELGIVIASDCGQIFHILMLKEIILSGLDERGIDRLLHYFPVSRSDMKRCLLAANDAFSSRVVATGDELTLVQFEIFRWWIAGKTLEDIATIMGIKRRTVRYHLDRVRNLYGYSTIQQTAVRIAIDYEIDPMHGFPKRHSG